MPNQESGDPYTTGGGATVTYLYPNLEKGTETQQNQSDTAPKANDTGPGLERNSEQPHSTIMSDTPTRPELDAKLAAAEARTQTQIAELRGDLGAWRASLDHTISALVVKLGETSIAVAETKKVVQNESRTTRAAVWATAITSLLAVVAIMIGLVQINKAEEANLFAAFQSGIAGRPMPEPVTPPQNPVQSPSPSH
jgi:hypothetical protein